MWTRTKKISTTSLGHYLATVVIVSITMLLYTNPAQAQPVVLREGCTTAYWIDADCDGYVIGGKVQVNGYPTIPTPTHMGEDANDNRSDINTPATLEAEYGPFTNIQNFKDYMADLGYTHPIGDVFFVSPNGNDATAQPNNINLPYDDHHPLPWASASLIGPGDVVVYLEGTYPGGLNTGGYQSWAPYVGTYTAGLQGTPALPIIIMGEPGKVTKLTGSYNSFGVTPRTEYVIVRGFHMDGNYAPGLMSREIVSLGNDFHHVQLDSNYIYRSERWGIFGYIYDDRDDITISNNVIHGIHGEHCMYMNDTNDPTDTDERRIVTKNIMYHCGRHAMHLRGGKDHIYSKNILHSVAMMGMEIKNGSQDFLVENNLIFNTARYPITIWDTNENPTAPPIRNLKFVNNTFHGKTGSIGFGDTGPSFAINIAHGRHNPFYTHENLEFYNNIFITENQYPFKFSHGPGYVGDIAQTKMENNVFWRANTAAQSIDRAGMQVCEDTPGLGATSGPHNFSYCSNAYVYDFDAMQNPTYRPLIKNNVLGEPLFEDFRTNYKLSPWMYNFQSTAASPQIGLALLEETPSHDIKGNPRGNDPDSGAYQHNPAIAPEISGLNPPSIQNGPSSEEVTISGENFDPAARVKIELDGHGYLYIPQHMVEYINSTTIELDFPSHMFAGTYQVYVENPNSILSNGESFVVSQNPGYLPSLSGMTPTNMPAGTQQFVTLTGQNLGSPSEFYQILVVFMGHEYALHQDYIHSVSPNEVVLNVPEYAPAATYTIRVRTWAGTTPEAYTLTVQPSLPESGGGDLGGKSDSEHNDGDKKQNKRPSRRK